MNDQDFTNFAGAAIVSAALGFSFLGSLILGGAIAYKLKEMNES